MTNKSFGSYGESLAKKYLLSQGYHILEENFRTKIGEIDIIAKDGQTICFIEVKTRKSLQQGQPFEAVHPWKMKKLSQLAFFYLKSKFHSIDIPARFDVVSIVQKPDGISEIQLIKNAFDGIY